MSMHRIPLSPMEEEGLRAHGLAIGTPSQLADVFRQGVSWGQKAEREACAAALERVGATAAGEYLIGKDRAELCATLLRAR